MRVAGADAAAEDKAHPPFNCRPFPTVAIAPAALFGVIVGAAWVATSFGINYGFGDRSSKLWLIDAGYHTLQFALYGVIIAAWR